MNRKVDAYSIPLVFRAFCAAMLMNTLILQEKHSWVPKSKLHMGV